MRTNQQIFDDIIGAITYPNKIQEKEKPKRIQGSGPLLIFCGDNFSLKKIKFRKKEKNLTSFYATFQCGRYNIF